MKRAIIQLETLTCPSCIQKIENKAKSFVGIDKESVNVSFNSSKLKFEFDSEKISIEEIVNGITSLGYDVLKSNVKDA